MNSKQRKEAEIFLERMVNGIIRGKLGGMLDKILKSPENRLKIESDMTKLCLSYNELKERLKNDS